MPRRRLTVKSVTTLSHKGTSSFTEFQDAHTPGLCLRVYPSGRRNWWHVLRGSSRRHKLGDYPEMSLADAVEAAHLRLSGAGRAPDVEPGRRTVAELVDHYEANYRTRTKRRRVSSQSGDRLYLAELRRQLGSKRLDRLTPDDVRGYLERWDGKPYAQNRALQRLRAMFRWASDIDWFDGKLPTRGLALNRERPRNRRLTTEEVDALIECMRRYEPAGCGLAVELASIYGLRIGEALAITWSDINSDTLTIADGKNGDAHTVPLVARARAILEQQRGQSDTWLFPGRRGKHLGYRAVYDAWRRCTMRLGIEQAQLRDLRHHRATELLNAKIPARTVAAITGHKDLRILRTTYHDVTLDDARHALESTSNSPLPARSQKKCGQNPAKTNWSAT